MAWRAILGNMAGDDDHVTRRALERLGRTLRGKWKLDKLIGVGGMAAVYAATHRNGKKAAVKMLHPDVAMNPDLKTRFLREGYVANAVEHPGAVSVLDDDCDDDGGVYLVMELLDGETLEARWERKQRRLDPGEVLSITDKLLDVLCAAHKHGIVHRDIKPENVFLTRDGMVKVLDFGIARLAEMAGQQTRTLATRAGSTMGTPAFMSPEQASGEWEKVDGQSDLWTVGAVMFTCISGRFVHEGRNLNEQLVASATRKAPSLGKVATDAPGAIVAFVDKALAFEKKDRWLDAESMQSALREAYWARENEAQKVAPSAGAGRAVLPPVDRAISTHMRAASVARIEAQALEGDDDATRMMATRDVTPEDDSSPTTTQIDVFDQTVPVSAADVDKVLKSRPARVAPAGASAKDEITGRGTARRQGSSGSTKATPPVAAGSIPPDRGAGAVSKTPSGSGANARPGKTPSGSGAHARALLATGGRPSAIDKRGRPAPTPPLRSPSVSEEDEDMEAGPQVFKLERSGAQDIAVKQLGGSGAHASNAAGHRSPGTIDGLTTTGAALLGSPRRRTVAMAVIAAALLTVTAVLVSATAGKSGDRPAAAGSDAPSVSAAPPPSAPTSVADAGGRLDQKLR